tara:strand:+ start:154 stop:414 length:261 start_codon:yes stop_codon:yes gene_type:complete
MENTKITLEEIVEINDKALLADGFDEAIDGMCIQFGQLPIVAYDYNKCINILIKRDGMSETQAIEYFDFNVVGSYMGPNSPVFIRR